MEQLNLVVACVSFALVGLIVLCLRRFGQIRHALRPGAEPREIVSILSVPWHMEQGWPARAYELVPATMTCTMDTELSATATATYLDADGNQVSVDNTEPLQPEDCHIAHIEPAPDGSYRNQIAIHINESILDRFTAPENVGELPALLQVDIRLTPR